MMLVGDLPSAIDLPQADRQSQPRRGVLGQLFLRTASQQCRSEGDRIASRNLQFDDVERGFAFCQRFKERWPSLPIGGDPAYSYGRWNIIHHNVVGVVGHDAVDVLGTYRRRPVLNETANGQFFVLSVRGPLSTPLHGTRIPRAEQSHSSSWR